jgi:hypothetical protein
LASQEPSNEYRLRTFNTEQIDQAIKNRECVADCIHVIECRDDLHSDLFDYSIKIRAGDGQAVSMILKVCHDCAEALEPNTIARERFALLSAATARHVLRQPGNESVVAASPWGARLLKEARENPIKVN